MSAALQLTDSGRYLLALALAGENLNFTKLAVGSGAKPSSADSLTDLVNPKIEMSIEKYTIGSNYITLKGSFSNSEVTTGFNWTETGVYATDENGNGVLYAYCNEGDNYSYIPAETEGKVFSTTISLVVTVDDAKDITVDLGDNDVYATEAELSELQTEVSDLETEVEDKLSKTDGGTVDGDLEVKGSTTVSDLLPAESGSTNIGSTDSPFGSVYASQYYIDGEDIKNVFALVSEAGYSLNLSIDETTYIMTLALVNKAGTTLSEKTIDFPIESMVIGATYASGVMTLTLQNGTSVDVSIADLVSGLVSESRTIAGISLKDDITAAQLINALGLSEIASKSIDTSIEEDSTNLITSGAVYEALQGLATANIVIAASDTDSTLAARANYIISTDDDAAAKINEAIQEIKTGGKIILLSGTYNCSTISFYAQNLELCGCGDSTIINITNYCNISSAGSITIKDCVINCTSADFMFVYSAASSSDYKSFQDFKLINCTVNTSTLALFAGVNTVTDSYSKTGVYYLLDCIISGAAYILYNNSGSGTIYGSTYDCIVTGCRFKDAVTFNSSNATLYSSATIGINEG